MLLRKTINNFDKNENFSFMNSPSNILYIFFVSKPNHGYELYDVLPITKNSNTSGLNVTLRRCQIVDLISTKDDNKDLP